MEKNEIEILFKEAVKKLESGGTLEASLEGEMGSHLSESRPNRRNGKGLSPSTTMI